MATNRFQQVLYEPTVDVPQHMPTDFIPDLTGLEGVLATYQGALDKIYDIPVPKHMVFDRQALQDEYLTPIRDMREKAINAFSSGSSTEGLQAMRNLDRFLVQSKQPGGTYWGFESRYGQEQERRKEIDKLVAEKERQEAAPYLYERIGYTPFRNKEGTINELAPSSHAMVLKAGEFDEWINKQLPFIKETFKGSGLARKYPLDQYNSLYEMREAMGVDFNKVIETLVGRLPDQYKDAFRQDYLINRYYNPDLPKLDESNDPSQVIKFDDSGNPMTDRYGNYVLADTPLGRSIGAAALGYQHLKDDRTFIKVSDEVGIHAAKKMAEEDMETTMRTAAYNTGIRLPKVEFDASGKVITGTRIAKSGVGPYYQGPAYAEMSPSTSVYNTTEKPVAYFNSIEFQQKNPVGAQVWNKMRDKAINEKWSDEKIKSEFGKMYKQVEDAMSVEDFTYKAYNSTRKINEETEKIVGKGKAVGNIANSTLYIMEPGEAPKIMSYPDFAKEYGISQSYFNSAAKTLGEVEAGANSLPEGKVITFVHSKGSADNKDTPVQKQVTLIATDIPIEDVQRNMPQYLISEPAFNFEKERSPILPFNIAVSDEAPEAVKEIVGKIGSPGGIYSVGELRWASDEMLDEMRYWDRVRAKQGGTLGAEQQKEYDNASKAYNDYKTNPEKDTFRGSHAVLYDAATNMPIMVRDENSYSGNPINRQMNNKDLNQFLNILNKK